MQEFKHEGKKYIECVNTCENESFNSLITLYAPKGVFWGKTYDFRVGLAILHHNEGSGFKYKLLKEILNGIENPHQIKDLLTNDKDLFIHEEDLPQPKKTTTEVEIGNNSNSTIEKKQRKPRICRKCSEKDKQILLKGHNCPFKLKE